MSPQAGTHRGLFLRNARWALASMILRYGVSFFVTLALARVLGVDIFGRYQYYLSVFAVIEGFATVLSYTVAQNELIGARLKFGDLWRSVRWTLPALTLVLLGALWVYANLLRWDDVEPNLLVFLNAALLFKLSDFLALGLTAKLEQHVVQMFEIVVVLAFNAGRLLVIASGGGLEELLACTVIQYALTFVALRWHYGRREGAALEGRFRGDLLANLWWKGLPMYAISVLAVMQVRIVSLIVPEMMSTRDLGLFSFASKMMEPVISAVLLPVATALPFLSHAFHDSREVYWQRLGRLLSLTTVLGVFTAVAATLFPTAWLLGFINPEFVPSADLFPIFALSIVGQCFSLLCNSLDVLHDKTSRALVRYVLMVFFQAASSVAFIRLWGLPGAAFAAFLSPLAVNLVYNLTYAEGRQMNRQWFSLFTPRGFARAVLELKHQIESIRGRGR